MTHAFNDADLSHAAQALPLIVALLWLAWRFVAWPNRTQLRPSPPPALRRPDAVNFGAQGYSMTNASPIVTAVDDVVAEASSVLTTVETDATAAGAAVKNTVATALSDLTAFFTKNGQTLPAEIISTATAAMTTLEQTYGAAVTAKADAMTTTFLSEFPGGATGSPVAVDVLNAFLNGLGFAPATAKAA